MSPNIEQYAPYIQAVFARYDKKDEKGVKDKRYIFVFTPERLISYFAEVSNPSVGYLFVDEAQKLLNDDTRAPLLYHSIAQAKRKSVNIYFASPNILNVEDFLKLFGSSQEESMAIGEKSVTQNKFFIDSFNKKSIMLLEDQTEYALEGSSLMLSYNIPQHICKQWKVTDIRISASTAQFFYLSTIKRERGLDYPFARIYELGLNIKL